MIKYILFLYNFIIDMRTKYCFLILFFFLPFFCFGQSDQWDSDNYIYSNYKYGFSWTLPNNVRWQKITGTEKHTVFKAVQPDTNITVFVNVNKINHEKASNFDIWTIYDYLVETHKTTDKMIEKNTGLKTISHTFEKCLLCGQHAYKSFHHGSLKDDRYNSTLEIISKSYYYAYKGYSYAVTIKMYKDIYEEVEDYIDEIFKGYSIINKTE